MIRGGPKQNRKKNNTQDSHVVPHHGTNRARRCLTSQSERDAVLSPLYGRSYIFAKFLNIYRLFAVILSSKMPIEQ